MGGSFNPPTVAHHRLMAAAIEALGADRGVFVPVSDAYLRRKMRGCQPPVVLEPELRAQMLEAMCDDGRMSVCRREIGTIGPQTMASLQAIQEENPDAEVYFLMGADKLWLLANLTCKADFLCKFRAVVFTRNQESAAESVQADEVLSAYSERIVMLPQPEGTANISSSAVRERMLRDESSEELLCPGVWERVSALKPGDFPEVIDKFTGECAFLGNRFCCRIEWRGQVYDSVDAAFKPYKGASESEKILTMESILRAKFDQNRALMQQLLATGGRTLINGNNRRDTFWGVDLYSWRGDNHLGRLLMTIRDDVLRAKD